MGDRLKEVGERGMMVKSGGIEGVRAGGVGGRRLWRHCGRKTVVEAVWTDGEFGVWSQ